MHSIRTKTTLLTVCAIIVAITTSTLLAAFAIKNYGNSTSNQILYLLCETGEKNLDAYFESVEQSVKTVSDYAHSDLTDLEADQLDDHIDRVKALFEKTANNTSGILTYYYRIDPNFSPSSKGFWYVNLDGDSFVEHEVTDITLYDTEDSTKLVWFTVPKRTGHSIWLPPYFTDNLDVYVLSYNVPIYKEDQFIGVIGIEVDYNTIAEQVDSITLYDNGYAFLDDNEGNIVYHPRMAMSDLTGSHKPRVPDALLNSSTYIRYNFDGVEKQAVWLPLSNGMRINVTVPIKEINANWHRLIIETVLVSAILIILFAIFTMRLAGRITSPLKKLTAAAEQVNAGNYDFLLDYNGDDEVGILTHTFNQLTSHLKNYISDLNSLAYADALTSVHNKRAFDIYMRDMQTQISHLGSRPAFAVGIFDCNNHIDFFLNLTVVFAYNKPASTQRFFPAFSGWTTMQL